MTSRLPPGDLKDAYPLSRLQAGMVFHSAYSPETGSAIYHDIFDCHLRAPLDLAALQTAVQQVVARHPVLRTSFDLDNFSQPLQLVHSVAQAPILVEDIWHLAPDEQEAALSAWREAEKRRPFDWTQPPLLRFQVHRRTEETFQFTLSFHHAILDGWSVASMLTELFQIYLSVLGKQIPPLKPPPTSTFRNFIALEQKAIESEEARRYWADELRGCAVITIPRWSVGQKTEVFRQVLPHDVSLSAELSDRLEQLARTAGVPLKSVLLATHLWVLGRLGGQSDVLTGLVSHGRPAETDGERVLGLFLNTLPFRLELSKGSWMDLIRETYRAEEKVVPFRLYPLVEIQKLHGGQPLFETAFNFIHFHVYRGLGELEDIQLLSSQAYEETNFTLGVNFRQGLGGSQMNLNLMYDNTILCKEQVEAISGYYTRTLQAIADDPLGDHTAHSLLSEAERHQLLVQWNTTQTDYPLENCLHQLFETQVQRTPHAVAVVFANQVLTYDELNRRANQVAHHLQSLGVRAETLVGICMERSLEMVVGIYGILKAGGAYVPLDPTYPPERLAFMMTDARVPVLLTQGRLTEQLAAHTAQVICLDTDWASVAQESKVNQLDSVTPDNLAYMIYTSGSTGLPKGAMNTHRGICNRLVWMQTAYHLTDADRVVQKTPFSFDVSVWEFFWPLLNGAQLVVARPEGHKDSAYLVQLITEQQITTLHFVPSMLQAFLEEPELAKCRSVQQVICSGEALPHILQQRFFARLDANLHNLYGPTEAAVDVTSWVCQRESQQQLVPIGYPIANIQIYVLDQRLQPVPVGVPGELHIGGVGLGRGYHNRPELTAEKFIPHPFSQESSARLYKTGDLVRYLPDGSVDFLGRLDYQVKVRGFRIELGEIEAALLQHPAIRETVVVARQAEQGLEEDKLSEPSRLVAYLITAQESTPTVSELHRFLQAKLPDYMLPAAFVTLETLPLTPSGKIDHRALPAPDTTRPELEKAFVAPRTPVEQSLAEIWAQVLKLERVGVNDNFLELGGDSILSLQIATRANRIGLRITPRLIFENQTVAELAEAVGAADAVQAEQGLVTGSVPLTPIQHWFFEQNLPDPHHFNQAILLKVPRTLEPALVEQAFQHLLRHHDALRLRFARHSSGWQQMNAGVDGMPVLTQIDIAALSPARQGTALETAAALLQASLNLTQGPLLRAGLLDLGAGRSSRLLIVIHHLAVDGVSWRILLEDLQVAYQQISRGETVQFAPKTTSFKRWGKQLSDYAQSEALEQELAYWLTRSQTQTCPLPVDYSHHRDDNIKASTRTVSVTLSADETRALLQDVPAAYHTQINEVLLTALALAFARWTGERSVLIDLEAHGREEILEAVDVSRTVGWFTAVFPVLLTCPDLEDLTAALTLIKEQLRSVPKRGIGYGLLRYINGNPEVIQKLGTLPQAEASFNYLGQWDQAFDETPLFEPAIESSGPAHSLRGSRRHLLEINGLIAAGQLQMSWTYSEKIHRQATIAHLAQDFIDALQALIAHCQSVEPDDYTPSDFPDVELSEEKLAKIFAELDQSSLKD